jgi:hypothetical protein
MANAEGRTQLEAGMKRAIEWISQQRQDDPATRLGALIDEASRRFDLSPMQTDFLYRHFVQAATKPQTA